MHDSFISMRMQWGLGCVQISTLPYCLYSKWKEVCQRSSMSEFSIHKTVGEKYLDVLLLLPRFCSMEPLGTVLSHKAMRLVWKRCLNQKWRKTVCWRFKSSVGWRSQHGRCRTSELYSYCTHIPISTCCISGQSVSAATVHNFRRRPSALRLNLNGFVTDG